MIMSKEKRPPKDPQETARIKSSQRKADQNTFNNRTKISVGFGIWLKLLYVKWKNKSLKQKTKIAPPRISPEPSYSRTQTSPFVILQHVTSKWVMAVRSWLTTGIILFNSKLQATNFSRVCCRIKSLPTKSYSLFQAVIMTLMILCTGKRLIKCTTYEILRSTDSRTVYNIIITTKMCMSYHFMHYSALL